MVDIQYIAFGRQRSISVPWSVVGNAMVAKRIAISTQGSFVTTENDSGEEESHLISAAWQRLTEDERQKIRNFISAGL